MLGRPWCVCISVHQCPSVVASMICLSIPLPIIPLPYAFRWSGVSASDPKHPLGRPAIKSLPNSPCSHPTAGALRAIAQRRRKRQRRVPYQPRPTAWVPTPDEFPSPARAAQNLLHECRTKRSTFTGLMAWEAAGFAARAGAATRMG